MGHHKRGRPKNRRAGCLLCKPHKANGTKGTKLARTQQERAADEGQPALHDVLDEMAYDAVLDRDVSKPAAGKT